MDIDCLDRRLHGDRDEFGMAPGPLRPAPGQPGGVVAARARSPGGNDMLPGGVA